MLRRMLAYAKAFKLPSEKEIDYTTLKGIVQYTLVSMKRVDMSGSGAQLAYFFLLSFFPLLLFLLMLLPYLNLQQATMFEFLHSVMPAEIFRFTENILGDVLKRQPGSLLSIGILGTIWSASRGIDALLRSLNRAYDVELRTNFINHIWALLFTIAIVFSILLALLFQVFGQQFSEVLIAYFGFEAAISLFWTIFRWLLPPSLIFLALAIMYWIVPNTNPRLKFVKILPGAIFSTFGWVVLTYGFSFYVSNFGNYSATYGSIGGAIVLLLWLYFTGMLLILGGIFNAAVMKREEALRKAV